MPTTIQLSDFSHQHLARLKEELKASSYDEVIRTMLKEKMKPKSLFGSCKGMGGWSREHRMEDRFD